MKTILLVLYLLSFNFLFAQEEICYPKVEYTMSFREGKVADTSQLKFDLTYKNISDQIIKVPIELIDGNMFDPSHSLVIDLEVYEKGRYVKCTSVFYGANVSDSLYTEYKAIQSGSSFQLSYNLIRRSGFIYKGKYRVKFYILKPQPYNSNSVCAMKYFESKWFCFEAEKDFVL